MDYILVIAFIGGIFWGVLFRLVSECFERKSKKGNQENVNDTEHSLLSQYHYAIARVYEDKDDYGFQRIIIKPISVCECEEEAVNRAREKRKYEREVIMSNPTCDLKDYWKLDNVRVIKIYGVD